MNKKVKVLITTEYIVACPPRYGFIIYVTNKKVPSLCSSNYSSRKKAIAGLNKVLKFYNLTAKSILG